VYPDVERTGEGGIEQTNLLDVDNVTIDDRDNQDILQADENTEVLYKMTCTQK